MSMIKFSINDKVITEISLDGLFIGEIQATKELLAQENNVSIDDIKISI